MLIALFLIPGALITAFYFLTGPLFVNRGFPSIVALLTAILVVLVPFELGYLLYRGKVKNDRSSLKGVISYLSPLPCRQYLVWVPVLLVWSFIAFVVLSPLDNYLIEKVFFWLPDWSFPSVYLATLNQYSRPTLVFVFICGILLNGIIGPVVEELYFRGYLLPRMRFLGRWAPLVNVLLFSLYHFFSPWQGVTRIIAFLPTVYVVAWKRNIYIGTMVHVLQNTIGMLLMLTVVL